MNLPLLLPLLHHTFAHGFAFKIVSWRSSDVWFRILGLFLSLASVSSAATISSGENQNGTINVGGADSWTFTAAVNDTIIARVGELSGENRFTPHLRLYGPNGALIQSDTGSSDAEVTHRATVAGSYSVVVSGYYSGDAGTYRLRFLKIPGSFVVPAGDEGGALTNGQNHDGTILVGDLDAWTITAAVNDSLLMRVGELSGGDTFTPRLRLYGPDGALIQSDVGNSDAEVTHRAATAGTYTVVVSGYYEGNAGTYRLRALKVPAAFTVPAGDEGGAVVNGQNHDGTITVGDLDAWTFTAAVNDSMIVRVGELSGDDRFTPRLRLYGPDGAFIQSDAGNTDAEVTHRAAIAGTYTVVVSGYYEGNAGTYRFRLVKTPGALTVPTGDEGGALTNGQNHDGTILVGDLDAWTFTAAVNDSVVLRVGEISGGDKFTPRIRLYGPDGAFIQNDAGNSDAEISHRATIAGTYTVVVSGNYEGNAGTYRLRLFKIPGTFVVPSGDEGGAVSSGQTSDGTILIGDLDAWTFTAAVNDPIVVRIGELSGGDRFNPRIRLYGPDGAFIQSDAGNTDAEITHRATVPGTYTVIVSGNYEGNAGTYRLTVLGNRSTATFAINLSSTPAAGGSVSGGGDKAAGSTVVVTATANPGYRFVEWRENGVAIGAQAASYSFQATATRNLIAIFESTPALWPVDLKTHGQLEKLSYSNRLGVRGDSQELSSFDLGSKMRRYILPVRLLDGERFDLKDIGSSADSRFFIVAELADTPTREQLKIVDVSSKILLFSLTPVGVQVSLSEAEFSSLGSPKRLSIYRSLNLRKRDLSDQIKQENLVVLTHGWNRVSADKPLEKGPFAKISSELTKQIAGERWSHIAYDWASDAATGGAMFDRPEKPISEDAAKSGTRAAEIGYQHGLVLGESLGDHASRLKTVHFIAHSAGSWVAYAAARKLREKNAALRIQITLLDPYMPAEAREPSPPLGKVLMQELRAQLSSGETFLENYYCFDLTGPETQQTFGWDIERRLERWEEEVLLDVGQVHSLPVEFYASSMTNFDNPLVETYGGWNNSFFRRDLIGGWNWLFNRYHIGALPNGSSISTSIDRFGRTSLLIANSTPMFYFQGRAMMRTDGTFRITDAASGQAVTGSFGSSTNGIASKALPGESPRSAAVQSTISLQLPGLNVQVPLTPMQPALVAEAGLRELSAPNGARGTALVLGDGQAHVVYATPTAILSAIGNVGSDGSFTAATSDGQTIRGNVGSSGASVSITNTPSGVTTNPTNPSSPSPIPVAPTPSRLSNLSIRSQAGAAAQTLIVGLSIGGVGTDMAAKPVLIRGVGPSLAQFGVTGVLADPTLRMFAGATQVDGNDNWAGTTAISNASAALGAFPLAGATSKDAAMSGSPMPGSYTIQIAGADGTTGVALAEIYDATPAPELNARTPRFTNLSARTEVGRGSEILIVGLAVSGTTPKTVLIRAVGPTLGQFGVAGVLADPQLELYSGTTRIGINDNWGGDSPLQSATTTVGAFGLSSSSKDSALLVSLQPGSYTVQVSGVGGTTGVALVEVYEVP